MCVQHWTNKHGRWSCHNEYKRITESSVFLDAAELIANNTFLCANSLQPYLSFHVVDVGGNEAEFWLSFPQRMCAAAAFPPQADVAAEEQSWGEICTSLKQPKEPDRLSDRLCVIWVCHQIFPFIPFSTHLRTHRQRQACRGSRWRYSSHHWYVKYQRRAFWARAVNCFLFSCIGCKRKAKGDEFMRTDDIKTTQIVIVFV